MNHETGSGSQGEGLEPLDNQVLAERIAQAAYETKATDVRVLRVRELVQYTDWFVICSGRSDRQVSAIRDHIQDVMRTEHKSKPLSVEGTEHNQWVLVDFGDVVVHVFYEPVRDFYQLDQLWGDAPSVEVAPPEGESIPQDSYLS